MPMFDTDLLNQLSEGVIVADRDGKLVFVNEAAYRMHGVRVLEIAPDDYSKTYHLFTEDGAPYPSEQLPLSRAVLQGETIEQTRWRIRRPDGSEIIAIGSARPMFEGLERTGAILTIRDDSDRFEAERALRESEARFRNMADHAPVMMWVTEPDGYCSYLNRSWYAFTGQTEDEALGFGWLKAVHPEEADRAERAFVEANANSTDFRIDYRLRRADGVYRWAIDAASPRFDPDGNFLGFVGSVVDIDDRKRSEDSLASQNRRLDLLARLAGWLIVEASPEKRIESAFRAIADEVGAAFYFNYLIDSEDASILRLESSAGLSLRQEGEFGRISVGEYLCGRIAETRLPIIIDDIATSDDPACAGIIALDGQSYAGFPLVSAGRLIGTVSFAAKSRQSFNEDQVALMRTVADLSAAALDRSRVIAALQDSEQQFRALADNVTQLAWMADSAGNIFWYNRRWYDYTGTSAESQTGWGWESVHDPVALPLVVERWNASLESGTEFEMTFPLRGGDGVFRPFLTRAVPIRDDDGAIVRWFGTNTDVTAQLEAEKLLSSINETLELRVRQETEKRTETEEALRQSQKLETLGQLTGGVAHDFNNLLTPIVGALDVAQKSLAEDPRAHRLVSGAIQAADRARILVQRLLAFSRRQYLQPRAVDIAGLVDGVSDLIHRSIGPQITLRVDIDPDLPPARVDPNQLELALINLAVNARDAMPDGGTLTITARAEDLANHERLGDGKFICIAVTDNGTGMTQAVIDRAIEPFFTTKDIGEGTGLGLSSVQGLALQSGGELHLHSKVGQGTTATLWLPVSDQQPVAADRIAVAETAARPTNLTALLVDDEPLVRAGIAAMLDDLGYGVIEAASAAEATVLADSGISFDLMITDHAMPGRSGTELARDMRVRRPDLPVLLVTGYAKVAEDGSSGLDRLSKPFRQDDLAERLERLLAGTA